MADKVVDPDEITVHHRGSATGTLCLQQMHPVDPNWLQCCVRATLICHSRVDTKTFFKSLASLVSTWFTSAAQDAQKPITGLSHWGNMLTIELRGMP